MPIHWSKTLLLTFLCCTIGGCISSSREEALRNSIEKLEEKVGGLEKELAVRDERIKTIGSKTAAVESTSSHVDDLKRQVSLTQGAVDELRIKFSRLTEGTSGLGESSIAGSDLDETEGAGAPGSAEGTSKLAQFERRIAKLELEVQSLASSKEPQSKSGGGAKTGKNAPQKTNPKYSSAKELTKTLGNHFNNKAFSKVRSIAVEVLDSTLGAEFKEIAQLFKAEAAFASENYQSAALEFSEFLTQFPSSDRRPRALLLAGDSYVYLKQLDTAKTFYKECVDRFPQKQECTASKERLDRLGS